MKKRVIAAILCLLLLAALLPLNVFASAEGSGTANRRAAASEEHVHQRELRGIVTALICPCDFCGRFYCPDCGKTYYSQLTPADVGMPIIDLHGSLLSVNKVDPESFTVSYRSEGLSFDSAATLKVQGNTSANFPKKNYNLTLLQDDLETKNKVKLVNSWGSQSKYCLKANYVDFSQSRNIVSARIFNQIVHSRGIDDELNSLPNGGVTDGFPVLLYSDGTFLGLYTLNIPKNKWMWGMKDGKGYQAVLFAEDWTTYTDLRAEIPTLLGSENYGWELEFCSTEEDPSIGTAWPIESMNRFINFLINHDGESFKAGIGEYTDVDRAIDVLIYTFFIHADDNLGKNIGYVTYDGTKWIPTVYDMDATWGMDFIGGFNATPDSLEPSGDTLLFERLLANYLPEIRARYRELRGSILTEDNIRRQFSAFFSSIPDAARSADLARWLFEPGMTKNNCEQILSFAHDRIAFLDRWFGVTPEEASDQAFRVDFSAPEGTGIAVYPSQDYSAVPIFTRSTYTVTKEGELTRQDGQVNFRIDAPAGYEVDTVSVSPAGSYANIKQPADTGNADTYRITRISSDITVTVTLREKEQEPVGFRVSFVCEGGDADILVYATQDYSQRPTKTVSTVSVDSDTGIPTQSGDGQVNFTVVPAEGYKVASVAVAPRNYKNIKGSEDTGKENTYRITKITADVTVTVTLESEASAPEGFRVAFVTDGHAAVKVYPSQDYGAEATECSETVSLDADTFLPTKNGSGQVNFTVVPESGRELVSVSVTPDSYKNLKGPADTGRENTYRITKITGDLTVTVTTARTAAEPSLRINASAQMIEAGECVTFRAETSGIPEGARLVWSVEGTGQYRTADDGAAIVAYGTKEGIITAEAKVLNADGSTLLEDSRSIPVKKANLIGNLGSWINRIIQSVNFPKVIKAFLRSGLWLFML